MWARVSSAARTGLSALACLVSARKSQRAGGDISGPATSTDRQARTAALRLSALEYQIATLKAMKRHDPRRGPLGRAIYSARHEMLRGGKCV